MTARHFSSKDGFIHHQQKTVIWGLQVWLATCKFSVWQGNSFIEGKGSWEGCSKETVYGFSLAESLSERRSLSSSSWTLVLLQGVSASPSGLPALIEFSAYSVLIFTLP